MPPYRFDHDSLLNRTKLISETGRNVDLSANVRIGNISGDRDKI